MKDPVCGMDVTLESKGGTAEWQGETYAFCSAKCHDKFVASPEQYLHPDSTESTVSEEDTTAIYTCPMHPEVEQRGPGSCPICGMALEPKEITEEGGDDGELRDMSQRFWASIALSAAVLFLAMGPMLGVPLEGLVAPRILAWGCDRPGGRAPAGGLLPGGCRSPEGSGTCSPQCHQPHHLQAPRTADLTVSSFGGSETLQGFEASNLLSP
jgi:YHS domain-containing protein